MNVAVLSLGSNSSDKELQMKNAIKQTTQIFDNVVVSEIYEEPAHNGIDAPYLNTVMVVSTAMTIDEVNLLLKRWEIECGRTPELKQNGVVPIDLDIVMWNREVVRPVDYSRSYVSKGIAQLLADLVK
ncbi:MAG: 2-amino-4-hydroxy-6-hydroxymethyldihydropteridine diphosphokinase [Muribaculaceae bacterium]|nr:2-amino-4-hydroxy-6-hydroxymethyldihydropteridine diphosphokinase [Muribaculaceae bacterium]